MRQLGIAFFMKHIGSNHHPLMVSPADVLHAFDEWVQVFRRMSLYAPGSQPVRPQMTVGADRVVDPRSREDHPLNGTEAGEADQG